MSLRGTVCDAISFLALYCKGEEGSCWGSVLRKTSDL